MKHIPIQHVTFMHWRDYPMGSAPWLQVVYTDSDGEAVDVDVSLDTLDGTGGDKLMVLIESIATLNELVEAVEKRREGRDHHRPYERVWCNRRGEVTP